MDSVKKPCIQCKYYIRAHPSTDYVNLCTHPKSQMEDIVYGSVPTACRTCRANHQFDSESCGRAGLFWESIT